MNQKVIKYSSVEMGKRVKSIIQAFKLGREVSRPYLANYTIPDCLLMPNNNFGNILTVSLANSNITKFKQVCKDLEGTEPDRMTAYQLCLVVQPFLLNKSDLEGFIPLLDRSGKASCWNQDVEHQVYNFDFNFHISLVNRF